VPGEKHALPLSGFQPRDDLRIIPGLVRAATNV